MSPERTCRIGVIVGRFACAAMLLGALGGCTTTAQEDYRESRLARTLAEEEELLTSALKKKPDHRDARLRRAWIYAMHRRIDDSLEEYDILRQQTVDLCNKMLVDFSKLPREEQEKRPKRRKAIEDKRRQDIAFISLGRARALEMNGRLAEAVESYTTTMDHDPAILEVYIGRASTYFKMRRYTESMNDYTAVLKRDIDRVSEAAMNRRGEWHLARGFAAVCAGEWGEAANDFQAAAEGLKQQHRRARAFMGLYFVACRIGRKDKADKELLAEAKRTRRLHKGMARPNTWIYRAEWYAAGLIDKRKFLLESLHPKKAVAEARVASAHYYIGSRLLVDGDKKGAEDAFTVCVATSSRVLPEYHLAKVELERLATGGTTAGEYVALAKKERDHYKQIGLLTIALSVDPNNKEARRFRGILHTITGACDRAVDDFTRLLTLCKTPVDQAAVLRYRGFANARNGNHTAAVRDYHAAAKLNPKLWQAHEGLARSLAALRRYKESAGIYAVLIKQVTWTQFGSAWRIEKAFSLTCAGNWKDATADWQAIMKEKDSPLVRATLYVTQCKLGNKDAATKALKTYVGGMKQSDWQSAAAQFLVGQIDETTFLLLSRHSDKAEQAIRTSRAHYYIGASNLIRGSNAEARQAFNKCVDIGSTQKRESWEYRMARAELGRKVDWR